MADQRIVVPLVQILIKLALVFPLLVMNKKSISPLRIVITSLTILLLIIVLLHIYTSIYKARYRSIGRAQSTGDVIPSQDGYYHYTVNTLVYQNTKDDGVHQYTVVFKNNTINMKCGKPMAFYYHDGKINLYNYYVVSDKIRDIARSVMIVETTNKSGRFITSDERCKEFDAEEIVVYDGTIPLFDDYDKMMEFFRNRAKEDGLAERKPQNNNIKEET